MSTTTRSVSTTISATDVRAVMRDMTIEVDTICKAARAVVREFDLDSALVEVSMLVLNDVISVIRLQFYTGQELVREYRYTLLDDGTTASGPAPNNPPLVASFPPGTRVRLTVQRNPRQTDAFCNSWFQRLNWMAAAALHTPTTMTSQAYGTFASGGIGAERRLLVNPRFDQPLKFDQPQRQDDDDLFWDDDDDY